MSNMSYCRFENTLKDLDDCYENMDSKDLSETETLYRDHMIQMCVNIAEEYGDELDQD